MSTIGAKNSEFSMGQRRMRVKHHRGMWLLLTVLSIFGLAHATARDSYAQTAYAGVWRPGSGAQWWNPPLPLDEFKAKDKTYFDQGFRLVDLEIANGKYTGVWRPGSGAQRWNPPLPFDEFKAKDKTYFDQGLRLVDLEIANGKYTGVWRPGSGAQWWSPLLPLDEFKAKDKTYFDQGLRLVDLEIANGKYTGVWRPGSGAQWWNPPLPLDEFKAKDKTYFDQGLRLVDLEIANGKYTGVWRPGNGAQWWNPPLPLDEFKAKNKTYFDQRLRLATLETHDASLKSAGFWALEAGSGPGKPKVAWQQTDGRWVWPIAHDLRPTLVHFVWTPSPGVASVDYDQFEVGFDLGGPSGFQPFTEGTDYWITQGGTGEVPLCPAGQRCVGVMIMYSKLRVYQKPWHIKLIYWKQPPIIPRGAVIPKYQVSTLVVGHPNPVSFFQTQIVPTFRHSSCSTCHSMGSPGEIDAQHTHFAAENLSIYATATPRGTQLRCASGCHAIIMEEFSGYGYESLVEKEWMAPAFDMDIDWSIRTDPQICNTLMLKLPTDAAVRAHFSGDARVFWALESGKIPLDYPSRPTAPPHSHSAFLKALNGWMVTGRPCCLGPLYPEGCP